MQQRKAYKAFLFDLNGTMINDMPYHIKAWHTIVTQLGATLTLEQVKAECYGKNADLLERIFPGRFTNEEKESMGIEKERAYRKAFQPQLKLIDGLQDLLVAAANKGIKMAIGSAAILSNVDFVLDGLHIRQYINAIVSADDVSRSKPHPETFLSCAQQLGIAPKDCLVFEDAPKGVEAAANAGMDCVVITTMHTPEEFTAYKNVIYFINTFNDQRIRQLA